MFKLIPFIFHIIYRNKSLNDHPKTCRRGIYSNSMNNHIGHIYYSPETSATKCRIFLSYLYKLVLGRENMASKKSKKSEVIGRKSNFEKVSITSSFSILIEFVTLQSY